jgi:protease I
MFAVVDGMARIAMPLGSDFEDAEYSVPRQRLEESGHEIVVVGSEAGATVKGKRGRASATVDRCAAETAPDDFDALVIPGGYSPDHLRLDRSVVDLVRHFMARGKLVAAICHGPQLLIEADAVRGRTLTSWPSVRTDLENAGARWVDREVVEDGNLITSRQPDDLEAFSAAVRRRLETRVTTAPSATDPA